MCTSKNAYLFIRCTFSDPEESKRAYGSFELKIKDAMDRLGEKQTATQANRKSEGEAGTPASEKPQRGKKKKATA